MRWAVGLSGRLGFKLPYPTAMDRLKAHSSNTGGVQNVAEHLKSPEAFLEYLRALDWKERAYPSGNQIAAQVDEIHAAGLADVACDFLDSVQNKETGLWHPTAGYQAVNGAFKISFLYLSANRKMPNADRILAAAVDAMTTDKEVAGTACYVYNTWYTVNNILRLRGEEGKTPEVLLRGAPEAIRQTTEKLKAFMVGDGSCSMCPGHTVAESQRARVAVSNNIKEGDVNATVIAAPSTTNSMYSALGLTDVEVPMLGDEEREIFIKSLGTACK